MNKIIKIMSVVPKQTIFGCAYLAIVDWKGRTIHKIQSGKCVPINRAVNAYGEAHAICEKLALTYDAGTHKLEKSALIIKRDQETFSIVCKSSGLIYSQIYKSSDIGFFEGLRILFAYRRAYNAGVSDYSSVEYLTGKKLGIIR